MKTLMIEKEKNVVAIERGFPDWETMENWYIDHSDFPADLASMLVAAMQKVCLNIMNKYEGA